MLRLVLPPTILKKQNPSFKSYQSRQHQEMKKADSFCTLAILTEQRCISYNPSGNAEIDNPRSDRGFFDIGRGVVECASLSQ